MVPTGQKGRTRSTWSTPFCTTTTTVSGVQRRSSQPAVDGVWCALVASSTHSAGPTVVGSVATAARTLVTSPLLSTTSSSKGRLTQSVTSLPARYACAAK